MSAGNALPMTKAYVAHCVGEAVRDHDNTVLCELGCPLDQVRPTAFGSWRDLPHSGGLGWSLPTAMGMKLAEPDRLIVATMGDGSYMFANPVACHQIAEANDLPLLTIVFNNGVWNAVRKTTKMMYPEGKAARANTMPMSSLDPSPDYAMIAAASRAWSATIEDGKDLPDALDQALKVIRTEKRQAMIEVMVTKD